MKPRELYIGCGDEDTNGAVGIDILPGPSVNVIGDLSRPPYPFKDNTFDVVHCNHVLEHLDDVLASFAEIHRICKNGARVRVMVVHYANVNMYDDPTHKRRFSYHTFHLLTAPEYEFRRRYRSAVYRLVRRYLHFHRAYRTLGIAYMANRFPYTYERYFCWLAPAWLIEAELEVVK